GYGVLATIPTRELVFDVEYPPPFTGEFQAYVKDGADRSEYGSMSIVDGHDVPRPVSAALLPSALCPPMGYQDRAFDPGSGIRELGLKISAQSDPVNGAGYRPFRGTIRITSARIGDVVPDRNPDPEIRAPERAPRSLPILVAADFKSGSGVDRPWPLG